MCFDFAYFFYNKEFFAFRNVFSTFVIAQVNTKLIGLTPLFAGTPGFSNHGIIMERKQSNDVFTLAQKYSPVFKKTVVNSERMTQEPYLSWVAVALCRHLFISWIASHLSSNEKKPTKT